MLTTNRMTRWQAFVWLWRNDPEAKWLWLKLYLKGNHLKGSVQDNLNDFGYFPKTKRKTLCTKLVAMLNTLLRLKPK